MTYEEARDVLNCDLINMVGALAVEENQRLQMSYEATDIAVEALNKQILMKPDEGKYYYKTWADDELHESTCKVCPTCGSQLEHNDLGVDYPYCAWCGQAILLED